MKLSRRKTAQVIEELIQLAREMREASARGEENSDSRKTNWPCARRRDPAHHCPGTDPDCAEQRHHRLDTARERTGTAARAGETDLTHVRLPAGQTKESDADGARTGRGGVRRLGCPVKALHGLLTGVFIRRPLSEDYFFS